MRQKRFQMDNVEVAWFVAAQIWFAAAVIIWRLGDTTWRYIAIAISVFYFLAGVGRRITNRIQSNF